jgi:hypothetical protein
LQGTAADERFEVFGARFGFPAREKRSRIDAASRRQRIDPSYSAATANMTASTLSPPRAS